MRLVAYTDNVELGGADLSMAHLLERLDATVEVTVLGVSEPIVERIARVRPTAAARVVRRPDGGHDVRSLAAHVNTVRQLAPDVFHASLSSPWSCQYGIAAAALARRPRIVAVYQLALPALSGRQRLMKRLVGSGIDRHVGVGERTSRHVEELVGLPRGVVQTIHNGVPDVAIDSSPPTRPGPLIGSIGRVEHQKGFDLLIRALPQIGDSTLVLVGDGSERRALEELSTTLGVADRLVWAGWNDDPRSLLGSFDVFVLPSRFEGFPLAVLEAMLARSAVVATDVGSVAEAVLDDETGLLVPPEDPTALARAINRLLADDELRGRLGDRGRELVLERFTATHMTDEFESLYEDLLR
jgi:glycosyltransferase involved in cell wall biosynthesis